MTDPTTPILEPGSLIRPVITHEEVKLLVERMYGISVLELMELDGYDDKNYKIIEDPNVKNPLIEKHCPEGYVLKIMNSMDSKDLTLVEAQNEVMNYLNTRSVTCPRPVRNVYGHLYSVETIAGKGHVVRLLEYVPGTLLKDVQVNDALLYQVGEFVANLDSKLANFNHSGLFHREHIWMLSRLPELEKFKYVIKDAERLDLVEEVIEEFKYAVVPKYEELERGVIHGDFNEMNVLVEQKPGGSKTDYRVAGILDFGDIQYSHLVFELAVAMTYMILVTGQLRSGGLVLAGYSVTRRLPTTEYRLLKILISARLVQSLILGEYTLAQDPNNSYVTSTAKQGGWELLKKLRKTRYDGDEQDPTDWQAIANEYLTRS